MLLSPEYNDDELSSAASIKSFNTSNTVRTTRDSIFGLYEHTPYANKLWSTSDSSFITAQEVQDGHAKVSEMVESYLDQLSFLPNGNGLKRDAVAEESGLNEDSGQSLMLFSDSHRDLLHLF